MAFDDLLLQPVTVSDVRLTETASSACMNEFTFIFHRILLGRYDHRFPGGMAFSRVSTSTPGILGERCAKKMLRSGCKVEMPTTMGFFRTMCKGEKAVCK